MRGFVWLHRPVGFFSTAFGFTATASAILVLGLSSCGKTPVASPAKCAPDRTASASVGGRGGDRPVRLAIISAVEARLPPLEGLLLSEGPALGGIEFVERAELTRVLEQQRLSAGGLLAPDKSIEVGRLLSADALLLIEPGSSGTPKTERIRVVETCGGVRLLDRQTPSMPEGDERSCLLADLRRCVQKVHTPAEKRRYLAAVGFRSEESEAALATEARILGTLLEQDLAALPGIVMLERRDVGSLTAEQTLAGLDPRLRSAAVVIEGGLRRDADGRNLIATMALSFPGQRKPREASARIPRDDLIGGRKALVQAVVAALEIQFRDSAPLTPREEAGLFTERAVALASHRDYAEAGALYEAAFALEPDQQQFIQGDSCYRSCMGAYDRYSQCERLRASLRANQFAKRYMEWSAKRKTRPGRGGMDERVYNCAAYANLFAQSVEDLLAREPSAKIWYDRTSGHAFYSGIEPGADEAETVRLEREIRRVQQEKWDMAAALRRQRGIPLDDLLLDRLYYASASTTPAEAAAEVKVAMAEIERLQASGHAVAVRFARFFSATNQPVDRIATLFRAVTVMVDWRWRAEELLPLLDWLSDYNDPAVKLIGLYGKTRLKGEPGRAATEKLVASASEDSCPVAKFVVRQMVSESVLSPPDKWAIWQRLQPPATKHFTPPRPRIAINPESSGGWIGRWAGYRMTAVSLDGMKEPSAQIVHLIVDERGNGPGTGGPIFILWDLTGTPTDRDHRTFKSAAEVRQYVLTRLRRENGEMTEVQRFKMKVLPYRAEMVLERDALYFNPEAGPLAIVRGEKVAYVTEADGLPMRQVGPMAWLEDRLYLGGAGALARFDPATGGFDLLASSRSVAPRHELDGGGLWTVRSILPDTEHKCLWLSVDRDLWNQDRGGESKYGIWKLTPADGSLRRVFSGPPGYLSRSDKQIVFLHHTFQNDILHRFDPQTEKVVELCNGYQCNPHYYHRLPHWALVNGDVITSSWRIITTDGRGHQRESRGPDWNYVLRLGPGVLACSVAAKRMWYIEPRTADEERELPLPFALLPSVKKLRTWHDVVGNTSFDAGLVTVQGEMVITRKANGSHVMLPIDRLSKADREYIAAVAKGLAN